MAGDVRGHDLDSWWQNRAAYREDVNLAVDQWRTSAERFSSAAGGAPVAASASPPNETLQSLTQLGQSVLAAMKNAVGLHNGLEAEHQRAQSDFAAEQAAIESECHQRVQAERERAHGKAHDANVRYEKSKVVVRKFIATLIFLVVLYVLVRF